MKPIRPWSVPAVRLKRLLEIALQATLVALLCLNFFLGTRLWPQAFPLTALVALVAILLRALPPLGRSIRAQIARGNEIVTREQAPELWDAVTVAAERAGIKRPRLLIYPGLQRSYAQSWKWNGEGFVAIGTHALNVFRADMIAATIAHEVAHLRCDDFGMLIQRKVIAAWMNLCAYSLLLFGIISVIVEPTMHLKLQGLLCCFVAALSKISLQGLSRLVTPHLRYLSEYAADGLGVLLCDDPKAMFEVMLLAALSAEDLDEDPKPNRWRVTPPPMARAKAILFAHPDALTR